MYKIYSTTKCKCKCKQDLSPKCFIIFLFVFLILFLTLDKVISFRLIWNVYLMFLNKMIFFKKLTQINLFCFFFTFKHLVGVFNSSNFLHFHQH